MKTDRNLRGKLSFRFRLICILMGLALLPIAANLGINLPRMLHMIRQNQRQLSILELQEGYDALDRRIVQRRESIRLFNWVPGVRDFLEGRQSVFPRPVLERRLSRLVRDWFSRQQDVISVILYDISGREVFKMVRSPEDRHFEHIRDKDLSEDSWVASEAALRHGTKEDFFLVRVQDVVVEDGQFHSHQPVVRIGGAVRSEQGRFVGMGVITIDVASLLARSSFDFLATGTGVFMDWSEPQETGHVHHQGDVFQRFPGLEEAMAKGKPVFIEDLKGREVAWFPILRNTEPRQNLWVGRRVDLTMAKSFRSMIISRVAVTSLLALILVLILVSRYSKALDHYRRELVEALKRLFAGHGRVTLDWKNPPEMAELAEDLNLLFDKFIENDLKKREALKKLSDLSDKMRMILDNAAEGIIEVKTDNEIAFVNRAACSILGFSRQELLGNDLHSVLHYMREDRSQYPREECPFCRALQEGEYHVFHEDVFWTRDGRALSVEYVTAPIKDHDGKVTGLVMCIRDVTARKEAEERVKVYQDQLRQAQKMEAIGTLAGGVAHDFNNLLTAIRGYSELLEMSLSGNDIALRQLGNIKDAADRAAALVRQLLAFSRKQVAEKRSVDLNRLVAEQQKMLKRLIGEDIDLEIKRADREVLVYADPNMIGQIIMNMVVNARDALIGLRQKSITIKVALEELSDVKDRENPEGRAGSFAVITISDTGSGMDQETLDKIFDPFFTTKEVGKGTGLGLAVAYGIVEQHGGWITCRSEPGQGTTFRIFLPAYNPAVSAGPGHLFDDSKTEPGRGPDRIGWGRSAMVIEDDPMVLEISRDMLETLGFKVLSAANIEEARDLAAQERREICLVVSDVVLPDGNGVDFVEELMEALPQALFLVVSGYVDERLHIEKIKGRKIPFLAKPFTIKELESAIKELMAEFHRFRAVT